MTTDAEHVTRLPGGAELTLRVPTTRDIESLVLLPRIRSAERLAAVRPLLFFKMVARVDGAPITIEQADAWAADPAISTALLPRLQSFLDSGRRAGIAYAQCPGCRAWEARLDVAALGMALGAQLPPLFEGEALAIPMLSHPLRRGHRPHGVPTTSRLRASLPSAVRGIDAPVREPVVGDIEPVPQSVPAGAAPVLPGRREVAAWAEWAPPDAPRPAGRDHWRHELPAFHAVLRLSLALDPDGLGDPALVERMPAIDFWFLDALYWRSHAVDVNDPAPLAIRCGLCGAAFLPVR